MGINEMLQVLKAFEDAAGTYAAVMADGKIGWTDIPKVMDLFPSIQAAIEGAGEIPAELKDLDPAEAGQLYAAMKAVYDAWRAAV